VRQPLRLRLTLNGKSSSSDLRGVTSLEMCQTRRSSAALRLDSFDIVECFHPHAFDSNEHSPRQGFYLRPRARAPVCLPLHSHFLSSPKSTNSRAVFPPTTEGREERRKKSKFNLTQINFVSTFFFLCSSGSLAASTVTHKRILDLIFLLAVHIRSGNFAATEPD
jgi:hypothetical protein